MTKENPANGHTRTAPSNKAHLLSLSCFICHDITDLELSSVQLLKRADGVDTCWQDPIRSYIILILCSRGVLLLAHVCWCHFHMDCMDIAYPILLLFFFSFSFFFFLPLIKTMRLKCLLSPECALCYLLSFLICITNQHNTAGSIWSCKLSALVSFQSTDFFFGWLVPKLFH